MLPLHIEGANFILPGTPDKQGKVRDLHVKIIDGCYVSRWEPSTSELALLLAGGSVELWSAGKHPSVHLIVKPHASNETKG